ncbi:hypothetical protein [Actinomadura sp. 6K520]|nr:hypothetical protein [Actinomadura sp. 6K520]
MKEVAAQTAAAINFDHAPRPGSIWTASFGPMTVSSAEQIQGR